MLGEYQEFAGDVIKMFIIQSVNNFCTEFHIIYELASINSSSLKCNLLQTQKENKRHRNHRYSNFVTYKLF